MTKKDFKSKTKKLIKNINEDLIKKSMELFESGGVDTKSYKNTYLLPKIILNVALNKSINNWKVLSPEAIEEVENLEHF